MIMKVTSEDQRYLRSAEWLMSGERLLPSRSTIRECEQHLLTIETRTRGGLWSSWLIQVSSPRSAEGELLAAEWSRRVVWLLGGHVPSRTGADFVRTVDCSAAIQPEPFIA